jgi:uncharacterized membrane protein YraQ (UPF0718 family)
MLIDRLHFHTKPSVAKVITPYARELRNLSVPSVLARFFWASIENPRAYGALTMINILLIGAISLTPPSR